MEYKIKTEGETSFQAFRPLFKLIEQLEYFW